MIRHSFVLSKNPGGFESTDDHWRLVVERHLKIWSSAIELLSNAKIEHGGRTIEIAIDWRPAMESCEQYKSTMEEIERFRDRKAPTPMEVLPKFPDRTKIAIEVRSTTGNAKNRHFHPNLYIENRLADIFLIMNIAEPGCCNFYLSSLSERQKVPTEPHTTISLSSILFELAQVDSLDGHWPHVSSTSLETIVKWFKKIRTGVRQLPQNQLEKVLFSILQLTHSDASPTSIIWIFYALETLLDTKPGENRAALERRLVILTEPTDKQRSGLKTKLRELYDYRSSIVHGGLSVASPLHLELLDKGFDDEYRRMLDLVEYGFALLLVCLQKVAEKGWTELRFKDVMEVR